MKQEVTVELAGGKRLHFETGRMAKQASGAALVSSGDTVVLATAVASPDPREGIDFFPLTVDYREYAYAGGRIPGGFIKREGRPSEREVLTCRQIDRPIRPLFPEGFRNETQIIALVFSADRENDPDIVGINAAGAALALSDIPFGATIGAVRVGQINGEFVINPSYLERRDSKVNITVVGTKDGIVMIESGANEATEDTVVDAIDFGHGEIKKIVAAIEDLVSRAGKQKRAVTPPEFDTAYYEALHARVGSRLKDALDTKAHPKLDSQVLVKQIQDELKAEIPDDANAASAEFGREIDCGLSAERQHDAASVGGTVRRFHFVGCRRFEDQHVGNIEVGGDRFGVVIHDDGCEAGRLQRPRRVHATIIELDALSDANRTATDDNDGLALDGAHLVAFAARQIVIRGFRRKLGGCSIDHAERRRFGRGHAPVVPPLGRLPAVAR